MSLVTCNPCNQTPVTVPAVESLTSALDNFITSFFGTIVRVYNLDGTVTWTLPCNLDVGLEGNPRLAGEGVACYLLRLINAGVTGLKGDRGDQGDPGDPGPTGFSSYSPTTVNFTEPPADTPVWVTLLNAAWVSVGASVFIGGSGWYTVLGKSGNSILLTITRSIGSGGTIGAGQLVAPSGDKGATGNNGNNGNNGSNGSNGTDGVDGAYYQFIFRRSVFQPATPTGDGIPSGWSAAIPAGADALWFTAVKQSAAGVSLAAWGVPIPSGGTGAPGASGSNGTDGVDGNTFKFVFIRSVSVPTTPTGNGVPAGWSATVPSGTDALYMSWVEQTSAGVSQTAWAPPVAAGAVGPQGPAGNFYQFVFIRAATAPTTPTGDNVPAGWSATVPSGTDVVWMSFTLEDTTGVAENIWSTPIPVSVASGAGTGNVVGPGGGSTDNALTRFDGTSGELVQNSSIIINDDGTITQTTNNAGPGPSGIHLQNTDTGNGRSALILQNDAGVGGNLGTYSSGFAVVALRGIFVLAADRSLTLLTDSAVADGGTHPILFRAGGYDTAPALILHPGNPGQCEIPGALLLSSLTAGVLTADASGNITSVPGGGGGGGIGGSAGAADNAVLRADGTGGATLQSSGVLIDDAAKITAVALELINPSAQVRVQITSNNPGSNGTVQFYTRDLGNNIRAGGLYFIPGLGTNLSFFTISADASSLHFNVYGDGRIQIPTFTAGILVSDSTGFITSVPASPPVTIVTTGASIAIDFAVNNQSLALSADTTFSTSNRASGKDVNLRLVGDGSARALTWPAGWVWVGGAAPTSLASGKTALLSVKGYGTADTDTVAAYAVQS